MILIRNITKTILGKTLYKNFSLTIHPKDRIGIVGPNGAGKSTLLGLICQMDFPDEGDIVIEKERIGYLEQAISEDDLEKTVQEYLKAKPHEYKSVLAKVGLNISLSSLREAALGDEAIQTGSPRSQSLPCDDQKASTTIKQLSGGQKTKLALAKVLAGKPTLLLLDEPTNHLDKDGIETLENIINEFHGAVVVVSHDRKLLNTCVNKIIEIDPSTQTVSAYSGNFDTYKTEKLKNTQRQEELYKVHQQEKKRLEALLKEAQILAARESERGPKVEAVKKRLEREIYNQEIPRPQETVNLKSLSLGKNAGHASKLLVKLENISVSLGIQSIFNRAEMEIRGSDRVLLEGENGSGKTSLAKLMTGEIKPASGTLKIGENIKVSYFDQEHTHLQTDKTVLEYLNSTSGSKLKSNPRSVLAAFGFRDNEINKSIKFLSHGEQVRLILAIMSHEEHDLLILDEPTNHLDFSSREILEDAIKNFQGGLIVISHDRYFIEQIGINKIYTIKNKQLIKTQG